MADLNDQVVGVVRLVEEEGRRVLRGMFIDEIERGRGLGRRMLQMVTGRIGPSTCWLVCGRHLAAFHGQAGFQLAAESEAPPHLLSRAAKYTREHGPQVVLRKTPGPS